MTGDLTVEAYTLDHQVGIQLIGGIEISISGAKAPLPRRRHTQRLLALLLLRLRTVSRSEAAFTLWPELGDCAGRAALRRHLSDLECYLQGLVAGSSWIEKNKHEITWRPSVSCRVDLHDVLTMTRSIEVNSGRIGPGEAADVERAITTLEVPLLSGWDETWFAVDRSYFQDVRQSLGHELVSCYERLGCLQKALEVTQRLLSPPSEVWFRRLISLQVARGDIDGSLKSFERCLRALGGVDGLQLDSQTTSLHDEIVRKQEAILPNSGNVKIANDHFELASRWSMIPDHYPLFLNCSVNDGAAIDSLVERMESEQLLVICGQHGSGKSRMLACAVVQLRPNSEQEVYWIDVSRLVVKSKMREYIPAILGMDDFARDLSEESLWSYQANTRPPRIVFDNCDDRIDEVRDIATEIASHYPEARITMSCRSRLDVLEYSYIRVSGLSISESTEQLNSLGTGVADCNDPNDEVLFKRRIDELGGMLTSGGLEPNSVKTLCVMADGIPLAIELLSEKSLVLNLHELIAYGEQIILDTSMAYRQLRQHSSTISKMCRLTFQHMSSGDQLLLTRMSICHGWFELDTAQAIVCDPQTDVSVVTAIQSQLTRLCNHEWIQWRESHADSREYRLSRVARSFCNAILVQDLTHYRETRRRYSIYYLSQVLRWANPRDCQSEQECDDKMRTYGDDLRAAVHYSVGEFGHQAELAIRASCHLWRHWIDGKSVTEELEWLEAIVSQNEASLDFRDIAIGYDVIGMIYYAQGNLDAAEARCRRAVKLLRTSHEPELLAMAMIHHAGVLAMSGCNHTATRMAQDSVALMTDSVTPLVRVDILGLAADICLRAGNLLGADAMLVAARNLGEDVTGVARRAGRVYLRLGSIAIERGEYCLAESMLERAVEHARKSGGRKSLHQALGELSLARRWRGQAEDACRLLSQVIRHANEVGDRLLHATCYCNLADVWFDELRLDQARVALERARRLSRGILSSDLELDISNIETMMMFEQEGVGIQSSILLEMEEKMRWVSDATSVGWAMRTMALAAARAGDHIRATSYSVGSVRHFAGIGSLGSLVRSLEVSATVGVCTHSHATAAQLLGACAAERARIGAPRTPRELRDVDLWSMQISDAIGPEEARRQIQAGEGLSFDEAVNLALSMKDIQ